VKFEQMEPAGDYERVLVTLDDGRTAVFSYGGVARKVAEPGSYSWLSYQFAKFLKEQERS
jgi:hypothetical protein